MKLLDILARELTNWAGDVGAVTQDKLTGELLDYYHCPLRGGNEREVSRIADDAGEAHDGAGGAAVTRAEWTSAVGALNAKKVVGLDGEMIDLMREEFEAACEARFNWALQDPFRDESERTLSAWNGESYRNRIVQGMWWAWQASRERLVIYLPIPVDFPDGTGDYHQMIDPDDLIDAIHAAGVKTK